MEKTDRMVRLSDDTVGTVSGSSVEEILKKHGVYTRDLEIDLLRHFVDLRNEILQGVKNTEQLLQLDQSRLSKC